MARHVVPELSSPSDLVALIRQAAAGDEIVVHTAAQGALAQRTAAKICPGKPLTFLVRATPFDGPIGDPVDRRTAAMSQVPTIAKKLGRKL